ncbi:hypothetical protein SFOMI_2315 [Sphingobium fuliginis]|uniref:Uncharacterized protein n=1 Tax=Sphingobium fuliginis (strain ATCC 27551) TaxID=336203 RepID=A0A292ZAK7_SPHSA|nr:hypothetical protein SFOMI_2315 [Sphingobium fuliginis]
MPKARERCQSGFSSQILSVRRDQLYEATPALHLPIAKIR